MKIGIYLAYRPTKRFAITQEGLGRYLAQLVRLLHNEGNKITIACPLWCLSGIEELFEAYDFSLNNVEFVTPRALPTLWKIMRLFSGEKKRKKRGLRGKIVAATYSFFEKLLSAISTTTSTVLFLLVLLGLAIVGLVLLPVVLVAGVLLGIGFLIKKLFRVDIFSKANIKKLIKKIITLNGRYSNSLKSLMNSEILEKMRKSAANEIITRIGRMKDPMDIWYCPMAFFSEFNSIKGVTVTCFPDLSTAFFPQGFSSQHVLQDTNKVRETVKNGKYFITYCNYQKNQVLSSNLGKPMENIRSIHLFVNETLQDIDVSDAYQKYFSQSVTKYSRAILNTLFDKAPLDLQRFLITPFSSFSFHDVQYIFYSSQNRPNKNILTLIKAYEYLLREKEVSFKLIITGDFAHVPEINEYVHRKRLQYDVLSFTNVSNQQLAALYACAELVVNPTLYEGGFLMIFAEGMSVGTPSIMGNIPQVTDVISEYDMSDCLFDPFDFHKMADKILYGISNRSKLYESQKPLYDALSARNLNTAGKEYIDAFKYFIALDKQKGVSNNDKKTT